MYPLLVVKGLLNIAFAFNTNIFIYNFYKKICEPQYFTVRFGYIKTHKKKAGKTILHKLFQINLKAILKKR